MNDASSPAVNSILQEFIKDYGRDAVQDALKRLQCGPDFIPLRFKEHTALRQNIIKAVRWAGGCEHFSDVSDEWMQSGAYRYPIDDTVYRIKSTYQLPPETPAEPEVFWSELRKDSRIPRYTARTYMSGSHSWDSLGLTALEGGCYRFMGFAYKLGDTNLYATPFVLHDDGVKVLPFAKFQKVSK